MVFTALDRDGIVESDTLGSGYLSTEDRLVRFLAYIGSGTASYTCTLPAAVPQRQAVLLAHPSLLDRGLHVGKAGLSLTLGPWARPFDH